MQMWTTAISIVTGVMTIFTFLGVFIKMGRDKGEQEAIQREMRKDIDKNAKDINCLGEKVSNMENENTRLISTLTSDIGWIKSSLSDIKNEIAKRG